MREHIEIRVLRELAKYCSIGHLVPHDMSLSDFDVMSKLDKAFREQSYTDPASFSLDYALTTFLKKWQGWSVDQEQVRASTLASWYSVEKRVFETNYRFSSYDNPSLTPDQPASRLICEVRRKIVRMIGSKPDDRWLERCDWPTGATLDTRMATPVGERVDKPNITVTRAAYRYAASLLGDFSHCEVSSSRQVTVPKTFKVQRTIACEPTVNAFLQKGVGRYIRSKLLSRCGIDLRYQADINRDLSFLARGCQLATIDLESASDTISTQVVRMLLPPSWYELLDNLRCKSTFVDSQRVYLEKFASMGNGYIFELETVIFRAIVEACYSLQGIEEDSTIAVFGDDIICLSKIAPLVITALEFFGFSTNREKTFIEGDFYESCGRHWFKDLDVTPVYQKNACGKTQFQLIALHNRLFRWGRRTRNDKVSRKLCALVRNEYERLYPRNVPEQPVEVSGDFGFMTTKPIPTDKHGDYVLSFALVLVSERTPVKDDSFYLQNKLRCQNSFYADHKGHIKSVLKSTYRIRKKFRVWRSGADIPCPTGWGG